MQKSVFLKLCLCALIWTATLSSATAGNFTIPEWLLNSCVFVMANGDAIGTGFFVGVKDSNDNTRYCYLVSAKHVIRPALESGPTLQIRLNCRTNDNAVVVSLPISKHYDKYVFEHPNPSVDLAVVLIPYQKINRYDVSMYTVDSPTNNFLACSSFVKQFKIKAGDMAFSMGLVPYLYCKDTKNIIMTRSGTISMISDNELALPGGKQKAMFLDCPAYGGQSGGPAFVRLERNENGDSIIGWQIALLGVVTEFVPSPLRMNEVSVSEQERKKILVPIENTGISKVVPVDYIVEILYSPDQCKLRNDITTSERITLRGGFKSSFE